MDASSSCTVSLSEFKGWFEGGFAGGTATLNGVVKPADSVAFPDTPNCSFYKWSEQMFLWLNSPAPPTYGGGGGRIFNSPAFFDVSPLDSNMDRTFIAHPSGRFTLGNLQMRAAQVGGHGLPVIMNLQHRMFEVDRPLLGPNGKALILNGQGERIEIDRIALPQGLPQGLPRGDKQARRPTAVKPIFFDKNGAEIKDAKPLFRLQLEGGRQDLLVQKFVVDKIPIFLDQFGNVVETEQGQADGSVLMAQNGSLVYFVAMTNDVYAYFLTGVKDNQIAATQFPTTSANLTAIKQFAVNHGGLSGPDPFPDSVALAVELKTAWVEASGLSNPNSYITMMATIPVYTVSTPNEWIPTSEKTVKMALVGMHVVGSTAGHPEMIWATFEHKNNAPNAPYHYASTSGTQLVNPDFSTAFLFCAANPDQTHLNEAHMFLDGNNPPHIVANTGAGFAISPSNTIRGNPWGAVDGVKPNPAVTSEAASNSELIKVNTAVRSMLDPADVRNNYIMTGATWTIFGGQPPVGGNNFGPGNTAIIGGHAVGTSQMANMTMETYQQFSGALPTSWDIQSNNCFSCHFEGPPMTRISHIFTTPGTTDRGLKPLFP
jgi:hypothetical protein